MARADIRLKVQLRRICKSDSNLGCVVQRRLILKSDKRWDCFGKGNRQSTLNRMCTTVITKVKTHPKMGSRMARSLLILLSRCFHIIKIETTKSRISNIGFYNNKMFKENYKNDRRLALERSQLSTTVITQRVCSAISEKPRQSASN